ncbi:hypothetical protein [Micromonospora sp. NPDC093244]|uniref:hypothetical protein n=1 Tax=Micromonospora sp. NPDC093244 TaxID=3155071 RepID=UPI003415C4DB
MGDRELSRKPGEIRKRLRNGTNPARDKAMLVEIGYKPVSEWDMEELAKGRPRNSQGNFRGQPPSWLTMDVQAEAMRRLKGHAFSDVMALLPLATKALRRALADPGIDPKVQFAAATWLMEQALGKAKQRMTIDAELSPHDKVKTALVPAILLDDGLPQDLRHLTPERRRQLKQSLDRIDGQTVLDGEFTEDDDEEEDAPMPGVDDRMPRPLREAHNEGRIL